MENEGEENKTMTSSLSSFLHPPFLPILNVSDAVDLNE